MNTYALKFEAELTSDSAVFEDFYTHFDGLISESFGRLLLAVYVDDHANGLMATKFAVSELEKQLGVKVLRIDRDLVDASEIARRTNRSRESIRQLVSGERRKGTPFPTPCATPNGKQLWEWAIVNSWLQSAVPEAADPECGLTRDEMAEADNWILRCRSLTNEQLLKAEFTEAVSHTQVFVSELRASTPTKSGTATQAAWIRSWNTSRRSSNPIRSAPSRASAVSEHTSIESSC